MVRQVNRLLLLLCAWAWATLLIVGGAILTTSKVGFGPWPRLSVVFIGLAGVGAGVFVFGVIVADRLFPRASGRVTFPIEMAAGAVMVIFTVAAIVSITQTPAPG